MKQIVQVHKIGLTFMSMMFVLLALICCIGLASAEFYGIGSTLVGNYDNNFTSVVFVNGTEVEKCEVVHKLSSGGDITPMGSTCFYRLNKDDVVDVRIADYTGTGAGVYYGMNLNLVRIGN